MSPGMRRGSAYNVVSQSAAKESQFDTSETGGPASPACADYKVQSADYGIKAGRNPMLLLEPDRGLRRLR